MGQGEITDSSMEPEAKSERGETALRQEISRRKLLKLVAGSAASATMILPGKWLRPVTELGKLPVHAQISQPPTYQYTLVVPGTANIWGAGHALPPEPGGGGAGTLPPHIDLPPGTGSILTFTSVTGLVKFGSADPTDGSPPDGTIDVVPGAANFNPAGGISGIIYYGRGQFLTGVVLDNTEPVDPPPATNNFTGADDWADFNLALRQLFFIGNGRLGRNDPIGTAQRFHIPDTATRLYLGLPDAYYHIGDPGQYADNSGSYTASFTITTW